MQFTEEDWNKLKSSICNSMKAVLQSEGSPITFDYFYDNSIKKIEDAFGDNYTLKSEFLMLLIGLTSNPETVCDNNFYVLRCVMDFLDNFTEYIGNYIRTIDTLNKLIGNLNEKTNRIKEEETQENRV